MPCLVLTGHPCVGKTEFAKKLAERALLNHSTVVSSVEIVNEESVCINQCKAECYATSQAEKSTRSSLKAKVDRSLSSESTLVICDSLNYIKGYRYELHCVSKAAKQKHGVIWILNSNENAKEWNDKRPDRYEPHQMEELRQRYEPPDARNRWDKPLWKVDLSPDGSSTKEALEQSVYNMHELRQAMEENDNVGTGVAPKKTAFKRVGRPSNRKQLAQEMEDQEPASDGSDAPVNATQAPATQQPTEPPRKNSLEEQIDDILNEFLLHVAPLQEGLSTRQHINAEGNVLHQVDSLTLKLCNDIFAAQSHSYGGSTITLQDGTTLKSRHTLTLAELQRLRKQYIRWISKVPPEDTSERGLICSFVQYVEAQVEK